MQQEILSLRLSTVSRVSFPICGEMWRKSCQFARALTTQPSWLFCAAALSCCCYSLVRACDICLLFQRSISKEEGNRRWTQQVHTYISISTDISLHIHLHEHSSLGLSEGGKTKQKHNAYVISINVCFFLLLLIWASVLCASNRACSMYKFNISILQFSQMVRSASFGDCLRCTVGF